MRWSAASDVGCVRERNEDSYEVFQLSGPGDQVFVVADGLGGQRAGDVASRLAVATLKEKLLAWAAADDGLPPGDGAAGWLAEAIRLVDGVLARRAAEDARWHGMGTTLTVLRVNAGEYQYAHVGDSRLYRFQGGSLLQVSRDHALVAELLRQGQLNASEAREHPSRHVLTQAVGGDTELDVDTGAGAIRPGDKFVLCTDGLTAVLEDSDLADALTRFTIEDLAGQLVAWARRLGAPDNVTVIAVDPAPDEAETTGSYGG